MLQVCLRERSPFGVALIREGVAEYGPLPIPYSVGCTAHITQVQSLENGEFLIVVVGHRRFRILALNEERPYLVGQVEAITHIPESTHHITKASAKLYPLVRQYVELLAKTGGLDFDASQVPEDAPPLAYLAAALLAVPEQKKQRWLESNRISHLLQLLIAAYTEELKLLRLMPTNDETNIFSLN